MQILTNCTYLLHLTYFFIVDGSTTSLFLTKFMPQMAFFFFSDGVELVGQRLCEVNFTWHVTDCDDLPLNGNGKLQKKTESNEGRGQRT